MSDPSEPSAPPVAPPPVTPPETPQHGAPVPFQARGRPSRLGHLFFAGLFATLAGLVWIAVERDTAVTSVVWIFAALLAMLVPFAWHAVDIVRAIASRRGAAFGFVAVTIGLALAVTVFVAWTDVELKKRGVLPTMDLTRNARYSLTDETQRLLEKVPGTIHATYLIRGQGDPEDPELRNDVLEQLHVYGSSTGRVVVQEADELRYPERAEQITREQGVRTTTSGEDTDLVVLTYAEPGREISPDKQKEIKVETYTFRRRSSTGATKWLGEGVITDAIYELVFQKNKAYATGGHGERSLREFAEFKDALTRQNIEVAAQPLMLSSGSKVPDDCDLLIVLAPQTAFSAEESDRVSQWLEKGRTLFLAVDLQDDRTPTGLETILSKFGIETRTNYEVRAPRVEGVMANGQPIARLATQFPLYGQSYTDHPAAKALAAKAGLTTYFVKSTYLEVEEDKPPIGAEPKVVCYAPQFGESARPIALRHSPDRKSYDVQIPGTDKNVDPSQPPVKLPLVATSSRKVAAPADGKQEGGERDARVIVSGDTDVFSDQVARQATANIDLARGLVQWGIRREGLVAVSERTLESPIVMPNDYQRRFAMWWPLFVCALPLIAGGMVWWSRRR